MHINAGICVFVFVVILQFKKVMVHKYMNYINPLMIHCVDYAVVLSFS